MLRYSLLIGTIILVNLLVPDLCFCDELTVEKVQKMQVEELIELLQSPNWREWEMAISYGVPKFINDKRVKVALFELLSREQSHGRDLGNGTVKWTPEDGPRGEAYGDILEIVCKLKDPRSIPLLIEAVDTGNMVTNALIEMGNPAIAPLLDRLKLFLKGNKHYEYCTIVKTLAGIAATKELSNNEKAKLKKVFTAAIERLLDRLKIVLEEDKHLDRSTIVGTLAGIAATKELSNDEKAKLRKVFIEAIETRRDRDNSVRRYGIRGLATFGDKESVALIQKVAIEDPYAMKITKGGKPFKTIYPVRDEARKILQELKEEKKNSEDGAK